MSLVLAPFAAAYFLSYFVRSINALIAPELTLELGLGAEGLGFLTASYFFAMAASQLPLGILYDRFGVQRIQSLALMLAGLGGAIFALGDGVGALSLARALIGAGLSGCLMGSFSLMTLTVRPERLALGFGVFLAIGAFGSLAATSPTRALLAVIDWRMLFGLFAIAMLALAGATWASPEIRTPAEREPVSDLLRGLLAIYRDGYFWRFAPVTVACYGIGSAIQGLWAGPWLADVAGLSRDGVAGHLFLMALALTIGSGLGGVVADRLGRRGIAVEGVVRASVFLFLGALAALLLAPASWSWIVWTLFGLSFNVVSLNYSILARAYPAGMAGRVNTGLNLLVAGGAFLAQYGIGWLIARFPDADPGRFAVEGYTVAFGFCFALTASAFAWLALSRAEPPGRFAASRDPVGG